MSHSVFKDFDDELNGSSDKADANLIVFIGKDGDLTVDQSALTDLIGECEYEYGSSLSTTKHCQLFAARSLF